LEPGNTSITGRKMGRFPKPQERFRKPDLLSTTNNWGFTKPENRLEQGKKISWWNIVLAVRCRIFETRCRTLASYQ